MNFGIKTKPTERAKDKVGLDIGSHAIKILEVSSTSQKATLVGLGLKNISGVSKLELSNSIRSLAVESKISAKEVTISISGPHVIVRSISMPKMKDEDLRSAIKFEAEKFIPFNINDCVVDFQVLAKDDGENKLNIMLVAAKKEYIIERVKLVEEAGFAVTLVDVDCFALTNAFLRNSPTLEPDHTFALLNIGATFTNLAIIRGGLISFARDVAIVGNDTSAKFSLSNLMDEVKLSFDYHENQSGRAIDEICISGGGTALTGLEDAFQEVFGSKPRLWNPLEFLDASSAGIDAKMLEELKSSFGVAVGLALR